MGAWGKSWRLGRDWVRVIIGVRVRVIIGVRKRLASGIMIGLGLGLRFGLGFGVGLVGVMEWVFRISGPQSLITKVSMPSGTISPRRGLKYLGKGCLSTWVRGLEYLREGGRSI